MRASPRSPLPLLVLLALPACTERGSTVRIAPGPDAAQRLQDALIAAAPGTTIELGGATYECAVPLSCAVPDVTLRGQGLDRTVLSFARQTQGGEGLLATADGFTLEDLAIEDTKGDGVKVTQAASVTLRRVRVEWTRGPHTENGGYGLYPIQCKGVLVEGCRAIGASDSGIYVGQSEDIVVRDNLVKQNVVGIEIENSRRADVHGNEATDNAGGIFVFDLPTAPRRNGGQVRVFANRCHGNNRVNFAAKGTTVAIVPSGTGILVMANDQVEIFGNTIEDHGTLGVAITSYRMTRLASEAKAQETWDEAFEPDAEAVWIHDNAIRGSGARPAGSLGQQLAALLGAPLPDIVCDGQHDPRKLVDGALPAALGVWVQGNGEATFADLRLSAGGPPSREIAPHQGALPPLPAVVLPARARP